MPRFTELLCFFVAYLRFSQGKYILPEDANNQNYDYIVVGAGAAGSALTRKLLEMRPQPSVLLLEAGGKPPDITAIPLISWPTGSMIDEINWNYPVERTNNRSFLSSTTKTISYPAGRVLGGGSTINVMLYRRGTKNSYDGWERDYGATGWNFDNVLNVFKEDERNNDKRLSDKFHGRNGSLYVTLPAVTSPFSETVIDAFEEYGLKYRDVLDGNSSGIYDTFAMIKNGRRCSSYVAFIQPIEDDCKQKLYLALNTMVQKVLITKRSGKLCAYGVEFVNAKGKVMKAYARKEVILSAGVVRSPQILMLSGIGPKNDLNRLGIKVLKDLPVGQNYQDDMYIVALYISCQNCIIDRTNITELFNWYIYQNGTFADYPGGNLPQPFLKSPYSEVDPDIEIIFFNNALVDLGAGLLPQLSEFYETALNKKLMPILLYSMFSDSRGHLRLQSTSIHDKPIIVGNYFGDKNNNDLKRMVFGLKSVANIINNSTVFRKANVTLYEQPIPTCKQFTLWSDSYFECAASYLASVGLHMTGTNRMGDPNRNDTVVDPELRVKGVERLRVADASVMPKKPHGHTTAPSIMIGSRCAKFLAKEHA